MAFSAHVIGLMSGSSLDGLDVVAARFHETDGQWTYEVTAADCVAYPQEWETRLRAATQLSAYDYLLLHSAYGHYLGRCVKDFIAQHALHDVALIASHGHTVFHAPHLQMTAQLGDGAAIAASAGIDTVSDLRAMDVAFGGQGAPIVPLGEKYLWPQQNCFLNLGGIANLSLHDENRVIGFDICPANRVLNALAAATGQEYDAGGVTARNGHVHDALLQKLNAQDYYTQPFPKSLDNGFGVDVILPLIASYNLSPPDALRTMVEHIAVQTAQSLRATNAQGKMLVTGGGAFNAFLVERIKTLSNSIDIAVPDAVTVNYKEALVMAFLGLRRLRNETTTLQSVTGASYDSIGGALWKALGR